MRAIVYAVETEGGWTARLTVAWEVDAAYWTGEALHLCRFRGAMPLGFCEAIRDRLESAMKSGHPKAWTRERAAAEMRRAAEAVWGEAGEQAAEDAFAVEWADAVRREGVSGDAALGAAELAALEAAARQAGAWLRGRSLLREEAAALFAAAEPAASGDALLRALQLAALRGEARLAAALAPAAAGARRRRGAGLRCRRCGSGEARMRRTPCASCGRSGCAVCEACATLGRSRECGLLALGRAASGPPAAAVPSVPLDSWGLSPAQRDASASALRFLRAGPAGGSSMPRHARAWAALGRLAGRVSSAARALTRRPSAWAAQASSSLRPNPAEADYSRSFLLWAVTGAGKTEITFPLLDAVLNGGGRAAVATPRKDVVLELAPRLAKAFPGRTQAVLYGGSEDRWTQAELTIATTHQLMRFQEAFDLVLIDELDAFPYHNDPLLHYAAAKARRPGGATLLLSATPPAPMQRAAKRGRLAHAKVPVRFHRHPLPEPRRIALPPLHRWYRKGAGGPPAALARQLARSAERGAQIFVFVPYIKHVQPLVELLRRHAAKLRLAPEAIDGTSSADAGRAGKVVAFRQRAIRLLVTTTILERGVTIPRSDVFILDAHQAMFDEAALVQMAGRAGRSAEDPRGRVFFCSADRTARQRGAAGQIRGMNRVARRRGYLLPKEEEAT